MTRQNSGFTLVEILVATAIFAVIMVAALMMYDRNQQVFKQSVEAADLQQNTRVAFDKMVSEVRMAGFDYDRDGEPTLAGTEEQPDEQIEYADSRALTFRANLDYDANAAGDYDNGREEDWESTTFPVVTTGNDEIVTYALHSKTGSNASTVTFTADVNKPRDGTESTISVDNIDLTGANPPYELQRITIDPADNSKLVRTTIADNIREMKFQYFTDMAGQAANEVTTMPLGDDANKPVRATVRSIHIELVGMNANRDVAYTNPTETDTTVTVAKNYRTYKLESLLVPRNLGLKGMQEVEATYPGAPTVKGLCVGACGFVNVLWDPPSAGASVSSYSITWDESSTGSFTSISPLGLQTNGWAGSMDPTKSYYFKVRSLNGYGSNSSAAFGPVFPTNKTKPEPPGGASGTGMSATGGATEIPDEIAVVWPNPTTNVSGAYGNYGGSTSCSAPPTPTLMPSQDEVSTYKVYRSTSSGFTPTDSGGGANLVWTGGLTAGVLTRDANNNITFHDVTPVTPPLGITVPLPKENCTTHYYKIIGVEACATIGGSNNNDAAAAVSGASQEVSGNSDAGAIPATPTGLSSGTSGCSSGVCNLGLTWNPVTQDLATPPKKIVINSYVVHRERWKLGSLDLDLGDVTTGTNSYGPVVEPQQDAFGNFYQYRYKVKAVQGGCTPASESAWSTVQIVPCANFRVNPPGVGVLSGTGSQGDPYLITSPNGTFSVLASAPLSAVAVTYTNLSSGVTSTLTATPVGVLPASQWNFTLPLSANDGTSYRIDVIVTDSANGCTTSNAPGTFVEDAPASCCLDPYKLSGGTIFNNAVLTLDTATNTVHVELINECDVNLTIARVDIDFTSDSGNPSGRLKLRKVDFISPAGTGTQDFGGIAKAPSVTLTTTTAPLIPAAPANVRVIRSSLANQTYTVDLVFQNRAVALADIKQVCITYTDPTGTSFACRIAPQASATASCNP